MGWLKNKLTNIGGALIGYAEIIGFKYPVKTYQYQVSNILWRGSRLNENGMRDLAQRGFKLVISLCAENDNDTKLAHDTGMNTLHLKIMDNQAPSVWHVMKFFMAMDDKSNHPTYIHCEAGKGRTGVMVACYRMAVQGWSVDDAITEAKKFGMAIPNQEQFLRTRRRDIIECFRQIKDI